MRAVTAAQEPPAYHRQGPDRVLRNMTVRIADLPLVQDNVLLAHHFENCLLVGPAVLAPLRGISFEDIFWNAPSGATVVWKVPDGHGVLLGGIGLVEVSFKDCEFEGVGLAVPESNYDAVFARLFGEAPKN